MKIKCVTIDAEIKNLVHFLLSVAVWFSVLCEIKLDNLLKC